MGVLLDYSDPWQDECCSSNLTYGAALCFLILVFLFLWRAGGMDWNGSFDLCAGAVICFDFGILTCEG